VQQNITNGLKAKATLVRLDVDGPPELTNYTQLSLKIKKIECNFHILVYIPYISIAEIPVMVY
jgi:hypothetical protein